MPKTPKHPERLGCLSSLQNSHSPRYKPLPLFVRCGLSAISNAIMRTSFFLTLIFLITRAWAGGYQGGVERVLLYYAYQIDGLNDAADRTLGFRCVRWVDYNREDDTGEIQMRKFNELMVSLGKMPTSKLALAGPAGADQNTRTPDTEEMARNVYHMFQEKKQAVYNFPPYKALKGADEDFNKYTYCVEELVALVSKYKDASNKNLFDGFEAAIEEAKVARTD
ncbi:hypothetical protein EDB80DRAFT_811670 [Ilyonectria destructans]|nr:hypothetical protein EDB80DRAFT_811670 [Ilyonectria destructans]